MPALRIGVLGAARIAPPALIRPARTVPGVSVAAIAARDPARAKEFAEKHGIETVHASYDELIADESLDAIYNPLPNGLHAKWTIAALEAGKHVLCEKPFTANAAEARQVATTLGKAAADLVVMEAFHYRYHPLALRMEEIVHSGELGDVKRIETSMCFPLPRFADIRYNFGLAGGALMDAGCYAVHCLRLLAPGEPALTRAKALTLKRDRRVDRAMTIDFSFVGSDATGRAKASMWSATWLNISARVVGTKGVLTVTNFAAPQFPYKFLVGVNGNRRRERFSPKPTYTYQLEAFAAAVRGEKTNLTPPSDSIATMELIDAAYQAAGLPLRG